MPDVTLLVRGPMNAGEAKRLETALGRLGFVHETNVDSEKGLLAVSYEGGETELDRIEGSVREAGFEVEPTPGAKNAGG